MPKRLSEQEKDEEIGCFSRSFQTMLKELNQGRDFAFEEAAFQ